MAKDDALLPNLPPRGLSRQAAAQYIGVSVGKFDQMVRDERMLQAIKINSRKVWDLRAIDNCFDLLGPRGSSKPVRGSWDDYILGDTIPAEPPPRRRARGR